MPETNKERQLNEINEKLMASLSNTLDPKLFDTLFSDGSFQLKAIQGDKATFLCEDSTTATIIKSTCLASLQSILSSLLENDNIQLEILDKRSYARRQESIEKTTSSFFKNACLLPHFSIDTFVVGPNNRSAYAAALYAINSPCTSNPIFLYSKSGLGKTHLIQAIGNEYKSRHPEAKVLYITSDDFLNEYVKYIRGERADELRDFFTTVDMLLIDDIQFLAGKKETQTMFFNIFNFLISHNRQIIITSDCSPSELKNLPDRLVTRFAGGLTVSITPPNKDTLVDILKMKIKVRGLDEKMFDPEVLDYLSQNYSKNVRELEGAFTTLLFAITTCKHPDVIDMAFTKTVFQVDEKRKENSGKITIDTIINEVGDYYSITESQLKSKSRIGQIALARQIAMYLARTLLNMTYQGIGKSFGKDHTTVMANVQKIQDSVKSDAQMKITIDKLSKKILAQE